MKMLLISFVLFTSLYASPRQHISSEAVQMMCQELHNKIVDDQFTPDLIVGISRGGLVPLGYLAGDRLFNIRNTYIISTKSYEKDKQGKIQLLLPLHTEDIASFTSILIVDDIVDSGQTIEFVTKLFRKTFPNKTIKTATLFYKPKSASIEPDYYIQETDDWIVFPWE